MGCFGLVLWDGGVLGPLLSPRLPKGAPIKRARGHRGMSRDVEGLGHTYDLQLAWKPESVLE